jgi:type IV pilus assembly protein PilB
MVGEIRDPETLEIALRAAVTGHLVLSTLHTNDAPSAFSRMIDMGAEPFLVSASVRAVLGQRLVRKVCPSCSCSHPISESELSMLECEKDQCFDVQRGQGCPNCTNGYRGRMGIYELLSVDEQIRSMIMERATFEQVRDYALAHTSYKTMRMDGIEKVRQGRTTPEEIARVTLG